MNILYYQVPITEVKHAPLAPALKSEKNDGNGMKLGGGTFR